MKYIFLLAAMGLGIGAFASNEIEICKSVSDKASLDACDVGSGFLFIHKDQMLYLPKPQKPVTQPTAAPSPFQQPTNPAAK